jgi:two-component system phosphate regulon sensor histidine kinase PhoR
MNKVTRIKILAYLAVLAVALLQTIWVTNAFRATEKQVAAQVDEIFAVSVNRELIIRSEAALSSVTESGEIGAIEHSYEAGAVGSLALILQETSLYRGYPISLYVVDTIFTNESAKINFYYKHIVNRINTTTGEILETTDTRSQGILPSALASQVIPIRMDGSEGIQVLVVSPNRVVFARMILILLLSFLTLLFIVYAVFFLLRSFVKEKQLRQMQIDFSNALIHNMKTPLATIASVNAMCRYKEMLANTEKREQMLDVSDMQVTHLQVLTDCILTIARSEEARLMPMLENVNISDIVNQLTDKFTTQTKKDVHFTVRFAPEKITFTADHTLLRDAISNLIDNAIKYSGRSVQIGIECRLNEMGLLIRVKDNGYGISEKDQAVIFAKFERGIAVSRKEALGFGLGLAYVKSVSEAHGGTVNMFSVEGEGSTFELFIPYQKQDTI